MLMIIINLLNGRKMRKFTYFMARLIAFDYYYVARLIFDFHLSLSLSPACFVRIGRRIFDNNSWLTHYPLFAVIRPTKDVTTTHWCELDANQQPQFLFLIENYMAKNDCRRFEIGFGAREKNRRKHCLRERINRNSNNKKNKKKEHHTKLLTIWLLLRASEFISLWFFFVFLAKKTLRAANAVAEDVAGPFTRRKTI